MWTVWSQYHPTECGLTVISYHGESHGSDLLFTGINAKSHSKLNFVSIGRIYELKSVALDTIIL